MKRNSARSARFLNRLPCRTWVSYSRKRLTIRRDDEKCSPRRCGPAHLAGLQPAGRTTWRAEDIEVPPFAEVLFRENLPKIAAILGNLVDHVAVSGDGPEQRAALL